MRKKTIYLMLVIIISIYSVIPASAVSYDKKEYFDITVDQFINEINKHMTEYSPIEKLGSTYKNGQYNTYCSISDSLTLYCVSDGLTDNVIYSVLMLDTIKADKLSADKFYFIYGVISKIINPDLNITEVADTLDFANYKNKNLREYNDNNTRYVFAINENFIYLAVHSPGYYTSDSDSQGSTAQTNQPADNAGPLIQQNMPKPRSVYI
jgi:hypothetical protein